MTIEGLGLPGFDTLAPSALAGLCVLLIMTGRLIPRRTHEDVVHDRDEWRTAHRISEAARLEGVEHQRAMAETATTMNQLMHELQERLRQSKLRELVEDDGGS
jgi:hypothetical protein